MPAGCLEAIRQRVEAQCLFEEQGDILSLERMTLPAIRDKRARERNDEPGLTRAAIAEFVAQVDSATVESVAIENYFPSAPLYSGLPAALVVSRIRYNECRAASRFRTLWVLEGSVWYSTALSKVHHRAKGAE